MQPEPAAVLGVDAAWTDHQPSGVALLQRHGANWRCARIAPSYACFCNDHEWSDPPGGAPADVRAVLDACLTNSDLAVPAVVAIDMPLSRISIKGRRPADAAVSKQFGHRKCAVHSPNSIRPGETGRKLQQGFLDEGYSLATQATSSLPALLEVYPHVALLGLTGRRERLPYKVGKTNTYWPGSSADQRQRLLIEEWEFILGKLSAHIDGINLPLPDPCRHSFDYLKRFEDAIDSLVCAWVATQFLERSAVALGDENAAIWIPSISMQFAKDPHGA